MIRINGHGHILPEPDQIPGFMKKKEVFWISKDRKFMHQKGWQRPIDHPSYFLDGRMEWLKQHHIKHEVIIPAPYLKGDCSDLKSELLNYGVRFEVKTQNIVCIYVLLANPKKRITTIKRAGWHGADYYLPGDNDDKEFVFFLPSPGRHV